MPWCHCGDGSGPNGTLCQDCGGEGYKMGIKELLESLSDLELRKQTETVASNIGAVVGSRITVYRILLEVLIQERVRRMEVLKTEMQTRNVVEHLIGVRYYDGTIGNTVPEPTKGSEKVAEVPCPTCSGNGDIYTEITGGVFRFKECGDCKGEGYTFPDPDDRPF